jgi:hypothetical protein
MPRNGSGAYSRAVSAYVYNTIISQTDVNAEMDDIATALTASLAKDGQTTPTANLPMGGFKLTGLAAGSAAGNSLRYEQLFTTGAVQLLGAMDWVKGANIASATTINLTTATGNAVHVTGTTQIDAVTLGSGMWRMVIFDGILTLAHSATNNNLPGGANITTAANDRALYWSDGTTVYCAAYNKASGKATVAPAVGDVTGLGTGVATALAVNVGSAGAPVVNGGALGTPVSGNLANCTGYPVAMQTIVQVVEASPVTSVVSCSTVIPLDNSIPQNTEGDEVITQAITPTSATNRLRIEFHASSIGGSGVDDVSVALFQDTTAGALAAGAFRNSSRVAASLVHEMAAGTTSATTFKIRIGPAGGSTHYVNGDTAGTRTLGGVASARLCITEIKV